MDLYAKVRRANDYFLVSHGIPTPEYFWKVILSADKAIA